MKTLYFECNMGAAGDMLMAALLELHPNPSDFIERLNGIGIPNMRAEAVPSVKCGITGTHIKITINGQEENSFSDGHDHGWHTHEGHEHNHHDHAHNEHEHHHHHGGDSDDEHEHLHNHSHNEHEQHHEHNHSHGDLSGIERLIGHLRVSDNVKNNALEVYKLIAEAESRVHGVSVDKIHFHEVGEMDALADITGVCMLIDELAPDLILASPINTGSGQVRCAHGILPVPAPAAAYILKNIPVYGDSIKGELCTPTGAALLKYFVKDFCKMPVISVDKLGYGMGKKDFEKANCVRAYLGESGNINEEVIELACNLDDMTPEAIAFAQRLLLDEGALDVYTAPVGMKKGRPGISFTCMCGTEMKDKMVSLIFKHTATLGIREYTCKRYTLRREQIKVETKYGSVGIKSAAGFGVKRSKPEYEDLARIAREKGISLMEALKAVEPGR